MLTTHEYVFLNYRKQLDAEAKLSNWTLTDNIYINHSIQKYFDCCDSKKKRGNVLEHNIPFQVFLTVNIIMHVQGY